MLFRSDLKTKYIMLDEKGHMKVINFGRAAVLTQKRIAKLCSDVEYTAPEVFMNYHYSKESDWWSLVIL